MYFSANTWQKKKNTSTALNCPKNYHKGGELMYNASTYSYLATWLFAWHIFWRWFPHRTREYFFPSKYIFDCILRFSAHWRFLREIGSIDRLIIICLFELETIQLVIRSVLFWPNLDQWQCVLRTLNISYFLIKKPQWEKINVFEGTYNHS